MSKYLTCVPAYKRDYSSAEAVLASWLDEKDFKICDISCRYDGSYVNIGDAASMHDTIFRIRYQKLEEICMIGWVDDAWKIIGEVE